MTGSLTLKDWNLLNEKDRDFPARMADHIAHHSSRLPDFGN